MWNASLRKLPEEERQGNEIKGLEVSPNDMSAPSPLHTWKDQHVLYRNQDFLCLGIITVA